VSGSMAIDNNPILLYNLYNQLLPPVNLSYWQEARAYVLSRIPNAKCEYLPLAGTGGSYVITDNGYAISIYCHNQPEAWINCRMTLCKGDNLTSSYIETKPKQMNSREYISSIIPSAFATDEFNKMWEVGYLYTTNERAFFTEEAYSSSEIAWDMALYSKTFRNYYINSLFDIMTTGMNKFFDDLTKVKLLAVEEVVKPNDIEPNNIINSRDW
jgi:hypothetical protein